MPPKIAMSIRCAPDMIASTYSARDWMGLKLLAKARPTCPAMRPPLMPPRVALTANAVSLAPGTLWPVDAVPRSENATAFQLVPQRPRCRK